MSAVLQAQLLPGRGGAGGHEDEGAAANVVRSHHRRVRSVVIKHVAHRSDTQTLGTERRLLQIKGAALDNCIRPPVIVPAGSRCDQFVEESKDPGALQTSTGDCCWTAKEVGNVRLVPEQR